MKNLSKTSTVQKLSVSPTNLNKQVVKLVSHAKEFKKKLDDALNFCRDGQKQSSQ